VTSNNISLTAAAVAAAAVSSHWLTGASQLSSTRPISDCGGSQVS